MSCDKLVFDLSQEIEGSPSVFVKKDWLNILDNMNQNYSGNQSVVDTSQLSNSNKWLSYREAYFEIPLLLTLSTTAASANFIPATAGVDGAKVVGLKSWFGQIIHSFTLDYNGTTVIQQTPYINMWNSFRLMTSLSLGDVKLCSNIGFYPDNALAFIFTAAASADGMGVCNNSSVAVTPVYTGVNGDMQTPISTPPGIAGSVYETELGNVGLRQRQQYISYDPTATPTGASPYSDLLTLPACQQIWKSVVYEKVNGTGAVIGKVATAIMATVYLKHIHSFFSMIPLLKGIFLKMTMNLNNTSAQFTVVRGANPPTAALAKAGTPLTSITLGSVSNPVGGVCPLVVTSGSAFQPASTLGAATYIATIQVGARCLNSQVAVTDAPLAKSIYLYVPAYTFNPVFEASYLSSPIKQIKYTDVYQYKVVNIAGNGAGQFNNLLTNGIANIKSVLIIPFYSDAAGAANTGLPVGIPVYQSPFDPAGTGPTSPLCLLGNFNVVVSGQNAIYNTQRYAFEQFNNQLKGQNSVNGDLTDGLTSSLVSSLDFEMEYCYYYVNVSRMLEVEKSVPKSVQIIGTNYSAKALDLQCFIEYEVDISIDSLTGSRV